MVNSISLTNAQSVVDNAFNKVANQTSTDSNSFENNLVAKIKKLVTSQQAPQAKTITVKSGDTVSDLAAKYHSSVAEIGAANNLQDVDLILVNQHLKIPKTTTHSSASTIYANNQNLSTDFSSSSNKPIKSLENTDNTHTTSTALDKVTTKTSSTNTSSSAEDKARAYIVQRESGGSYTARNGKYIGKYQLNASYLHGDYSPANQEKVAQAYVKNRYGTWQNAMKHWQTHNWY